MTREERIARSELVALASHERGRRLLQLSLRGIQESERGLTIGCWVKPNGGVSGCVFQHAYWQGAAEGAFAPASAAGRDEPEETCNDATADDEKPDCPARLYDGAGRL